MLNKRSGIILIALLLSACASAPKIDVLRAPGLDFADYSHFSFVDPLGTDRAGYASLISQQLVFSIRRELELKGFVFVEDAAEANFLVNAYASLDDRVRTRQVAEPYMGRSYWDYRHGMYTVWPGYGYTGTRTELDLYAEGNLTIDLIDAKSNVMIWEGTARDEVKGSTKRDVASAVDDAVVRIFKRFP